MLFGLGVAVSNASSEETLNREAAVRQETRDREDAAVRKTERREAQRAAETLERDKYNREEARRDARLARDEARRDALIARDESRRDAKAARDEAFARERILQSDADRRADDIRWQAADDEKMARLLEKRAQGWAVIGPLVSKLELSTRYVRDATKEDSIKEWREDVFDVDDEIASRFSAHFFYFSPEFTQLVWSFTNGCVEFVDMQHKSDEEKRKSYQNLVLGPFNAVLNAAEVELEDPRNSQAVISLD
jgi:hypothetical protein